MMFKIAFIGKYNSEVSLAGIQALAALPKQGFVSLKIYDVLGREVRTLVNEVKSAGNFSVDFNASEFSSGVYFYRLESNGFSDIKRMMLIK